jgi:hypothetical protein
MSNEKMHTQQPEFEQQDVNPKVIFWALLGLGMLLVVSYFIVIGFYHYMDGYQKAHQPPQNPLAEPRAETAKPTRAETQAEIKRAFPEPRLEEDERGQMNSIRLGEEEQLNSYGWTDEKAGTVHIPIERAMELTAQRGLPVYSEKAATPASKQTPATKKGAK